MNGTVPVIRLSIWAAEFGVRSWKSWNVIVPEKVGSPAPLEVCVTPMVQNWPWATLAVTPDVLSVVTVKVWGSVLPVNEPIKGT